MLERWLDVPKEFKTSQYGRAPFAVPGGAKRAARLLTWPVLGQVTAAPGRDVLVARNGVLRRGTDPETLEQARALFEDGWTVAYRDAHRWDLALAELARAFSADLGGSCAIQLYATPQDRFGFNWHYDAEEVIILQTSGVKEYFFRPNTVNPRPRIDAMPKDMQYEREKSLLYACTLQAGDWLHLPAGWWHKAEARRDSFSISAGLLPTSATKA